MRDFSKIGLTSNGVWATGRRLALQEMPLAHDVKTVVITARATEPLRPSNHKEMIATGIIGRKLDLEF